MTDETLHPRRGGDHMTSDEFRAQMRTPNLMAILRFFKEWGWILVLIYMQTGFGIRTPKDDMQELRVAIAELRVSAANSQQLTSATNVKIEWLVRQGCRKLTASELDAASFVCTQPR